jgi:hypothetical protein
MNRFVVRAVFMAGLAALLGCSPEESASGAPTYYQDVEPIIEASCFPCHETQNIAPIAFPTYDDAKLAASVMSQQVVAKTMPPWMPDDSCRGYLGKTTLADADIETIRAWAAAGAPEGDPAHPGPTRPPRQMPLERVDVKLEMPVTFTQTELPDQLRCFTLDWPLDHDAFITGFTGVPGDPRVVHHISIFIAEPDAAPALAASDAADPGPGWDCFGGPGPAIKMASWVPGVVAYNFPPGTGYAIKKGGKIVIQMHYNADNSGPHPDHSAVEFEVADHVPLPARTLERKDPAWIQTLDIPPYAADTHVESIIDTGSDQPAMIRWVNLHQHYLGSESSLYLVRKDGSRECLLHIPQYNFHWQESYLLTDPVPMQPGDRLDLSCHWDNRPTHQRIVDGVPATPAETHWGVHSSNEMCLGTVYVTPP